VNWSRKPFLDPYTEYAVFYQLSIILRAQTYLGKLEFENRSKVESAGKPLFFSSKIYLAAHHHQGRSRAIGTVLSLKFNCVQVRIDYSYLTNHEEQAMCPRYRSRPRSRNRGWGHQEACRSHGEPRLSPGGKGLGKPFLRVLP